MPRKTGAQLDREIAEVVGSPSRRERERSMFPSAKELSAEYLVDGGFTKLHSGVTKVSREPFEIYGTPNGSYSIRLRDSPRASGLPEGDRYRIPRGEVVRHWCAPRQAGLHLDRAHRASIRTAGHCDGTLQNDREALRQEATSKPH